MINIKEKERIMKTNKLAAFAVALSLAISSVGAFAQDATVSGKVKKIDSTQ